MKAILIYIKQLSKIKIIVVLLEMQILFLKILYTQMKNKNKKKIKNLKKKNNNNKKIKIICTKISFIVNNQYNLNKMTNKIIELFKTNNNQF